MNLQKSIIKNTIYLNIKTVITTILSLFSTRIVLNALGTEDFGIYGIVAGSITMLGMLNSAMTLSTQRFMNLAIGKNDEIEKKKIFNNSIILHLYIGGIIVLLIEALYYPLFNGILSIPEDRIDIAKQLYHFMCISTFFTIITVPYDALINAHENFLYYSIVGILESILKLLSAFLIIWTTTDKLFMYGLFLSLITIMMMLIMRIYCKKKYSECIFSLKKYYDKEILKDIANFAGWRFIGVVATFFGNYGSNILMNHFFGTIVIAAKNIGDQIGGQLQLVSGNMMRAFNPVIVKAESIGESVQMINLSLRACKFGYLLYLILAIPFIISMPLILNFWLKIIPPWTILFCQLQVIRMLLEQLANPLYISLTAKGDIKCISIYDLILGIITFISLFIFYYFHYSPETHYTVSIIILVILSSLIKIYLCKKKCNLSILQYTYEVFLPCLYTTAISIILCHINTIFIRGFLLIIINILITTISIIYVGTNTNEKQLMKKYITLKIINVLKKQ